MDVGTKVSRIPRQGTTCKVSALACRLQSTGTAGLWNKEKGAAKEASAVLALASRHWKIGDLNRALRAARHEFFEGSLM